MDFRFKKVCRRIITGVLTAVVATVAVLFPINADAAEPLGVSYSAFYSNTGWGIWNMDNTSAMQHGSHIGALKLGLYNQPAEQSGTILYQVNVSKTGWLEWVENGAVAGSEIMGEPLESVRVKLSGDLEAQYDIYTKVLQNDNKWTAWAKNGEDAGTAGVGTHIRGIRISVLQKGSEAPNDAEEIDPGRPMIALTFDDGPSVHTPAFLDVLEKYNARATFFVLGGNLRGNQIETVKRAVSLGNEIGNHTMSHLQLTKRSASSVRAQIDGVTLLITGITGVQPTLFRPPYGSYNSNVLKQLTQSGYACILWSLDTLDWKTQNANETARVVLEKAKDGDIVLMHDSHVSSAKALERIVQGLQARGFQLVTVSELAMHRGGVSAGQTYSAFR